MIRVTRAEGRSPAGACLGSPGLSRRLAIVMLWLLFVRSLFVIVANRSAVVPQTQREEERKEEMQDEGEAETTDPFAPAAKSRNY